MEGIGAIQRIDQVATKALLVSGKLSRPELGWLRCVLTGSVRLQKRLFQAELVGSPICMFCGMSEETLGHCFWDCAHWSCLRARYQVPDSASLVAWPACTRECGIFLEDESVPALSNALMEEEEILCDFSVHFKLLECRNAISANDPWTPQKIWTDGASAHNQDIRFRRAGSGIYYGPAHVMNWSGMLPGLAQSNQRAELFAVLVACLRDPRTLDIRSDSEWVCRGFHTWRTWAPGGWQGDHADLWDMLVCELLSRDCDVSVSWVKGHATIADVDRGRATSEDKAGNDGADKLAVDGAAMHHVPAEVVAAAKARRQTAKRTHEMMVAILIERQKQENLIAENDPDRGSEMGDSGLEFDDCMELLNDEFDDGENIQSDVH